MNSKEQFYERDQLMLWGHILEEWLEVRDHYSIIPPTMDPKIAREMTEARQIVLELIDKLKKGKSSVMKDPDEIDPIENLKMY